MTSGEGEIISTTFTAEFWVYFKKLSTSNDNVVATHSNFWKIAVEPSAQTWVLYLYSSSSGSYRSYATLKFAPLNTWLYVAVQFDCNKASVITYPNYAVASFPIDTTLHTFIAGTTTAFSLGGSFTGYFYSMKYWNTSNYISEATIAYPTTITAITNALMDYHVFSYEYYDEHSKAFDHIIQWSSNYIELQVEKDFDNAPPMCNSITSFKNSTCQGTASPSPP